jgi:hypothetical protein
MTATTIDDVQREHIRMLHDRNGGNLTRRAFVDDAADENSPLHPLLEWNDAVAGDQYRLIQAGTIIRNVEYTYVTEKHVTVAPVYMKNPDERSGYTTVAALRTDEDRARSALIAEFIAVRGRLVRARSIARVLDLESEIDALLTGVVEIQRRFDQPSMSQ